MDADLAFLSAREQAELIRRGDVSPSELVDGYLERIDALDGRLHSYLTVAADFARAAAQDAEQRIARADVDGTPFLGVPISIKDLADTAGIRTTHGTATYADRVPDVDDEVVARIKRAGFLILGKTNTPEFGSRSTTESPGYPTARNPWDTDRTPGGSSGGAGAALAAGLCPIAHGSDGGGSIRIPAAWCGLVGLKPSRGRVSWSPGPQSANATNGPLARTVADAAAFLDAVAGYATGDFWWAPPPSRPFLDEVGHPPGQLRIAFTTRHPMPEMTVAEAWREAVVETARLLESLGHIVVEGDPPEFDVASTAIIPAAARAADPDLPPLDTLDFPNRTIVSLGNMASAKDLAAAQAALQVATRRYVAFFDDFDLLLTPTLASGPPRVDEQIMGNEDWEGMLELLRIVAFTPAANMTGQPAIALPTGLDAAGLPVSIHLVGRPADEATVLRVAAQLEEATPPLPRPPEPGSLGQIGDTPIRSPRS
ncbi:MAG TPA: amidase [Acidimicrobiia bacterium]|nr:amidase [Acidimicrobiia bacterium]